MHVALFTDLHPATFGGAQISVDTQRRALEQLGHQVTVFAAPFAKTPDPDPCVVELRPVPVIARLAQILSKYDDYVLVWPSRTNRALIDEAFAARGPIDIVHTQGDLGVAIAGMEAARRHGIPVVQTKHTRYDAYFEQAIAAGLLLAKVVSRMQKPYLASDFSFKSMEEAQPRGWLGASWWHTRKRWTTGSFPRNTSRGHCPNEGSTDQYRLSPTVLMMMPSIGPWPPRLSGHPTVSRFDSSGAAAFHQKSVSLRQSRQFHKWITARLTSMVKVFWRRPCERPSNLPACPDGSGNVVGSITKNASKP